MPKVSRGGIMVELEELQIELINIIVEIRSDPIPEMMDKHFKLHKNSVQFGLDRAVEVIDSVIEAAIANDNELNDDGTYGA